MPIPITEHPKYGERMADYQRQKNEAAESGDQSRIAAVDAQWQGTVNQLQNEMYDRQQSAQALASAVADAKALVPNIPDAVLAPLTTPEQVKAAAQALKEQMDVATPAPTPLAPAQQQPPAQSWGGSPPTSPSSAPADPNDPKLFHEKMFDLAGKVETDAGRNPRAVEQFGKEYFDNFIMPGLVKKQR